METLGYYLERLICPPCCYNGRRIFDDWLVDDSCFELCHFQTLFNCCPYNYQMFRIRDYGLADEKTKDETKPLIMAKTEPKLLIMAKEKSICEKCKHECHKNKTQCQTEIVTEENISSYYRDASGANVSTGFETYYDQEPYLETVYEDKYHNESVPYTTTTKTVTKIIQVPCEEIDEQLVKYLKETKTEFINIAEHNVIRIYSECGCDNCHCGNCAR